MTWSENFIARALAEQFFNRKYLVVVPNCNWTGHECDILAVTENLRIIDVEIKISRSDLKADAGKDKWLAAWEREIDGVWSWKGDNRRRRVEWPRKVWKHYYVLPEDIWADDLLDTLGSPASGVLLLSIKDSQLRIRCHRPAKPCRDADKISAASAIDIARLASLRMWKAYRQLNSNFALVQNTSGPPASMMDSCTQNMDAL